MATLDFGANVTLSWEAAPQDATVALEIIQPDGLTLTLTPSGYPPTASFTPALAGRHVVRWSADGPTPGAYTDLLDVWPLDPRFLISLDDALNAVNAKARMPAEDREDMRLYIAAATPVIEDIVGPVLTSPQTFVTSGGAASVVLPQIPSSITAVAVNGVPLAADEWFEEAGIVTAGLHGAQSRFGAGQLVVSYTVGMAAVPPNVRLGTRELVRHWWQIGKQSTGGAVRGQEYQADSFTPSGFAVPRRVIELCAPHQQVGGFA
ncbi:hypothetical protein [Arthrobacter sp. HLT1-20]